MKYIKVHANEQQQQKLFKKHLKSGISEKSYIPSDSNTSDFTTSIIELKLLTGIQCSFQLREYIQQQTFTITFVEFIGFKSDVKYIIQFPKDEILEFLIDIALKAKKDFWEGAEI